MGDLIGGAYPAIAPEYLLQALSPADASRVVRQNMSRTAIATDITAALSTGVMLSVALPLQAGDIVTKLTFKSGATAAGTPTHWWFALYDPLGNLLGQTADQLTAAWAADTTMDLPLTTPYQVGGQAGQLPPNYAGPGAYRAAVMVAATTPPSLVGLTLARAAVSTGIYTTDRVLAQTSGSTLTTTAPATIASPTAVTAYVWAGAH